MSSTAPSFTSDLEKKSEPLSTVISAPHLQAIKEDDYDEGAAIAGLERTPYTAEEEEAVKRKIDRRVSASQSLLRQPKPYLTCPRPLQVIPLLAAVSRDFSLHPFGELHRLTAPQTPCRSTCSSGLFAGFGRLDRRSS